jgi:hypothetical protein
MVREKRRLMLKLSKPMPTIYLHMVLENLPMLERFAAETVPVELRLLWGAKVFRVLEG